MLMINKPILNMFFIKRLLIACILIILTVSCNLFNSDNPDNPSNWPEWDAHHYPPPAELLEMKLVEVPEVIEQGRTVELKMEVKNLRDEDLRLAVGGAPAFQSSHPEYYGQFDFMVTAFDENTLYWRYYYKFGRLDGILGVEISAGETLVLTHEWDGRDVNGQIMKPGRYNITGLYEIIGIIGEKETFVKDHEIGYYTTEPMEIVIE
jgi:hypothetical protein